MIDMTDIQLVSPDILASNKPGTFVCGDIQSLALTHCVIQYPLVFSQYVSAVDIHNRSRLGR